MLPFVLCLVLIYPPLFFFALLFCCETYFFLLFLQVNRADYLLNVLFYHKEKLWNKKWDRQPKVTSNATNAVTNEVQSVTTTEDLSERRRRRLLGTVIAQAGESKKLKHMQSLKTRKFRRQADGGGSSQQPSSWSFFN
jgi:hypothetical protein